MIPFVILHLPTNTSFALLQLKHGPALPYMNEIEPLNFVSKSFNCDTKLTIKAKAKIAIFVSTAAEQKYH